MILRRMPGATDSHATDPSSINVLVESLDVCGVDMIYFFDLVSNPVHAILGNFLKYRNLFVRVAGSPCSPVKKNSLKIGLGVI